MYTDIFENAFSFNRVSLPSTRSGSFGDENGFFWKRSLVWKFLKTLFSCSRVDGETYLFENDDITSLVLHSQLHKQKRFVRDFPVSV